MSNIKDENGNELIGYIDVGGLALPRTDLAKVLPDIERFERCLDESKRLNRDMLDNGGVVPDYARGWSRDYMDDVAATMRETGEMYNHALAEMTTHKAIRDASGVSH